MIMKVRKVKPKEVNVKLLKEFIDANGKKV